MTRIVVIAALVLATLLPAVASAQPGAPASIRVVDAKVEKGKLQWTEALLVPVTREIEVVVNVNGMNVRQKRAITVNETVQQTRAVELKGLKASDGAGKAIAADKLAEMLKEPTPVVIVSSALSEKHRKLFKETAVFIEMPAADTPGIPPPAVPVPPVVVPAPGGTPPVILPPGEKKNG